MLAHTIITASAGSGKTWSLTVRYIRLLSLGAEPERIIALTFSRKAAGEFLNAILHRLAEAAASDAAAARLAADVENPALDREFFLECLAKLASRLHVLALGTFDSFFIRIARGFPFELGLSGDFTILDAHGQAVEKEKVYQRVFSADGTSAEERREFLQAFQQATWGSEEVRLRAKLDSYIGDWHNAFLGAPAARRWGDPAVIWPEGAAITKAAGSRSAIIRSIRAELEKIVLTGEQRQRWEDFLPEAETHQPGAKAAKALEFLLDKLLEVYADLAKGSAEITVRKKMALTGSLASHLHTLCSDILAGELELALRRTRGVHAVLERYDRLHHDLVRKRGGLTFQDVPLLLGGASSGREDRMTASANRELIDYRLDARYDHWLLDEFQDTSRVQWRVLENLCDEVIQDTEGTRSFFAVGDQKQSIHVWRGAEPALFDEIRARYNSESELRVIEKPLTLSQRSGPAVIDMVNAVTGNLPVLRSLLPAAVMKVWPWLDHSSAHPEREGCAVVLEVEDRKKTETAEDEPDPRWEAAADLIRELSPLKRGLSCAVLMHRNDRALAIADLIRSRTGMDVVCEGDAPAARDNPATSALLDLLKAAAHPGDGFAWGHALMTPLRKVMEIHWKEDAPRPEDRDRARKGKVLRAVRERVARDGFHGALTWWATELRKQLPGLDSFSAGRLELLCRCAREFDTDGGRDTDEFLAFAGAWRSRESAGAAAIQVMTVHKSKGLTFDMVLLPDLPDMKPFRHPVPAAARYDEEGGLEWITLTPRRVVADCDPVLQEAVEAAENIRWREALAVLYVALTRAKHANYLILPKRMPDSETVTIPRLVREALGSSGDQKLRVGDGLVDMPVCFGDPDWIALHPPLRPAVPAGSPGPQPDLFDFAPSVAAPAIPPSTGPAAVLVPRRPRNPSAREEGDDEPAYGRRSAAAGLFAPERKAARAAGTVIHRLLSLVPRANTKGLAAFEKAAAALPPELAFAAEEARACLTAKECRPVFLPAASSEIWIERAFDVMLDDGWISGVFDRAILTKDKTGAVTGALLIDYKSARPAADGSLNAAAHESQMRDYLRALSILTGLPASAIHGWLLFTAVAKMVRITAP